MKNRKEATAEAFVKSHPDYVDNYANAEEMRKLLNKLRSYSQASFEKAYEYLKGKGLLELKAA
jgi:ABC-type Zn uptake system ZnuABC Zn-binding protein ZnuA